MRPELEAAFRLATTLPKRTHEWQPRERTPGPPRPHGPHKRTGRAPRPVEISGHVYASVNAATKATGISNSRIYTLIRRREAKLV